MVTTLTFLFLGQSFYVMENEKKKIYNRKLLLKTSHIVYKNLNYYIQQFPSEYSELQKKQCDGNLVSVSLDKLGMRS